MFVGLRPAASSPSSTAPSRRWGRKYCNLRSLEARTRTGLAVHFYPVPREPAGRFPAPGSSVESCGSHFIIGRQRFLHEYLEGGGLEDAEVALFQSVDPRSRVSGSAAAGPRGCARSDDLGSCAYPDYPRERPGDELLRTCSSPLRRVGGGLTGCPRSRETVTAAARRVARDRRYRPARLPRRMDGTTGATRAVRPTPSACRSSPLARAGARRQPRRRRGRGLGPFDGCPPTPALPPVLAARPSRPRGAPGSAPPHGRRRWPPCHGSRTVRSQPVREAWSTGAEVAGAPLGRRAVHHRVLTSPSQDLPALQR